MAPFLFGVLIEDRKEKKRGVGGQIPLILVSPSLRALPSLHLFFFNVTFFPVVAATPPFLAK
jgi:hypothetical protein